MHKILRTLEKHSPRRQLLAIVSFLFLFSVFCPADSSTEFHKTLAVANVEPVRLMVEVSKGNVDIVYSRDGGVSISATAQSLGDFKVDENYFLLVLSVNQTGNTINVRQVPSPVYPDENVRFQLRIEVPYRTEIKSALMEGKQSVRGVTGPVDVKAGRADVSISYVSDTVRVDAEYGNLDFQMIGERVVAETASGNISAERLVKGIQAETGDGDIKLMVVGPSEARVRTGTGRIEIGGARDTLAATTDSGDLHVQAVPHNDWILNSTSGSIRLELPPSTGFDLKASTESGKLQFERDDLPRLASNVNNVSQKISSGGKKIEVHTNSGNILIR